MDDMHRIFNDIVSLCFYMLTNQQLVLLPVDDDGGDLLVHEDQDGALKNKVELERTRRFII